MMTGWSTEKVPGQLGIHGKTMSQKTKYNIASKHRNKIKKKRCARIVS